MANMQLTPNSRTLILSLILILFFITFVNASPINKKLIRRVVLCTDEDEVPTNNTISRRAIQCQEPPGEGLTWELLDVDTGAFLCATDRSSDYYGLGVRLGVYLGWLSAWLANVSVPEEIAGSLDTNAIFLFAIIIALIRCTITGLVSRLDGLILMHLAGGTVFSVMSLWGYRTCVYVTQGHSGIANFGGFGTHLRLLLCMVVSVYGLWFWYIGVTGGLYTGTGGCEQQYTFFFVKLRIDGGIRIWYIFICIACTIYFGIMTLVGWIIGPLTRLLKMRWLAKHKFFRSPLHSKYTMGFKYGHLRRMFVFLALGNLVWVIWTMVMIEITLNYNHLANVLGENGRIFFPSQLIPLTIGVCGFVRVIYLRWEQWRQHGPKPTLDHEPPRPEKQTDLPRRWSLLKLFSPETMGPRDLSRRGTGDRGSVKTTFEDEDRDPDMVGQPAWWQYLASWLPWLTIVKQWRDFREEPKHPVMSSKDNIEPSRQLKQSGAVLDQGHGQSSRTQNPEQSASAA